MRTADVRHRHDDGASTRRRGRFTQITLVKRQASGLGTSTTLILQVARAHVPVTYIGAVSVKAVARRRMGLLED